MYNTVNGDVCIFPFLKVFLLLAFFPFLFSCKHEAPVSPPVITQFVPPNNCLTQVLGVKDSFFSNSANSNQILSVNYISRANGGTLSMFEQGEEILDNYDHQGLIMNGTYYFLVRSNSGPGSLLECINLTTELTQTIYIPNLYLSYLVCDSSSQTFFARSHYSGMDSLASFQVSSTAIINYQNIIAIPNNLVSQTIDPATGKIYLLSNSGSSQLSVYSSSNGLQNIPFTDNSIGIIGLRFNVNDNFLYALQDTNIIKINPATGAIAKLHSEPYQLSSGMFGAVMDQCNNQYIISGLKNSSTDTGVFIIYDNSLNGLASAVSPWYCYTALSVK